MINKVTLLGRLGQDPEFRMLDSGVAVARLSVATSRNWQNDAGEWMEDTSWHNVVAWRKLAERAKSSLSKGDLVYVDGELAYRKKETETGTRYYTDVNATYFRKVTGRRDSGQMPGDEDAPPSFPSVRDRAEKLQGDVPGVVVEADDDLPF